MHDLIFVMIKPWSLHHLEDILGVLDQHGTRLNLVRIERMPLELISRQYEEHADQPYYQPMIQDHEGKPAIIVIYVGNKDKFRELKKGIRERFLYDIPQHYGYRRDVLHCSDDEEEFNRENKIWEKFLDEKRKI